jgi:opacity protein-like surface antigen
MRSLCLLVACAVVLAVSAASADSRVFIIANQADGYGVDQCLAKGEKCGAHAARSYCQSRDFAQASSYRRVDPEEITGSVPKAAGGSCNRAGCNEYVAITCQR